MVRLADGSLRLMQDARREYPDFDLTRTWALPPIPANDGESLADYLTRIGFTAAQLDYTRRSYANAACESPERLSARIAIADMADNEAGTGDYRILDGYNRLHEAWARGLDIRLNSVVRKIRWGANGVEVKTTDHDTYRADCVIITLPLGVLKANRVEFDPPLLADKQAAIDALLMGPALKLIYKFDRAVLPEGIAAVYSAGSAPMWWSSSVGHPSHPDETVITAFVTGDYARALHARSEAGALAEGLRVLSAELARPLQPTAMTWANWIDDPFALGGYSAAPPGAAGARDRLAAPINNVLYWAGEATAPDAQAASVHGAYLTGRRAAREILATLAPQGEASQHRAPG